MDFRKTVVTLLAAMVFLLSVVGCSKPAEPSKPADPAQPAPSEPAEIVVGWFGPLTGDMAVYGQDQITGVKYAVDEINASGGVLGKKIKLVSEDDRADNVETVNVVKKLVDQQKAVALIGSPLSRSCLAAIPLLSEKGIPIVAPTPTNPLVTVDESGKVRKNAFRLATIDPEVAHIMARFAHDKLGAKTAAIIYDMGDDAVIGQMEVLKKDFPELGGKIIGTESFKGGDEDFRVQLTKIKSSKPDVVLSPNFFKEAALIVKQAKEQIGMKDMRFVGTDSQITPGYLELGGKAVEGTYLFANFAPDNPDPVVKDYVAAFKAKTGGEPTSMGTLARDSMILIADSIKRANSTDPQAICKAMEETSGLELPTGTLSFSKETHNPEGRPAVILIVKDGKFSFFTNVDTN